MSEQMASSESVMLVSLVGNVRLGVVETDPSAGIVRISKSLADMQMANATEQKSN